MYTCHKKTQKGHKRCTVLIFVEFGTGNREERYGYGIPETDRKYRILCNGAIKQKITDPNI
eukprot:snap_masked-scaffold_9-processed-gene-6.34-mRNA-1 protein AED:1.00 eAED:1.00 QI:0/-1/0/0/-1/1/1/0/60